MNQDFFVTTPNLNLNLTDDEKWNSCKIVHPQTEPTMSWWTFTCAISSLKRASFMNMFSHPIPRLLLSVVTVVLLAMKNPIQNSKAGSDRASFFETPWDLVRRMGENLRIVDVQDLVLNFVHQNNIIHLDFRGERCWCQAHGRIDPPGTLVITFKGILL